MTDDAGGSIQIEGLATLVRTLNRAGEDISDLKDANASAAAMVAAEAESRAPRVSGRLAGSIKGSRKARGATIQAGRSKVPYAAPIHWGWPARNIAPQPFLTDAAAATEPRWVAAYLRDLEAALKKVRGV